MTTRKYTSRSQQTTLTSAVTSGALIIPVVAATTLLGGATVSAGQTFTAVIDPDTALEEVVDITAVSSNNLTITRAIDGSSAQDHSAGSVVRHMIIGRDLRESNTHIETAVGVHSIAATSYVVGTHDAQTLTNKTFTTPAIAGATLSGTVTSTATVTGGTITGATITGLSSAGMSTSSATPKDYVDAILGSATAASTSATSAAASATAAATSAASAAASATAAATSASSASTSQTAAATSATSAATQATAATTSATSAAASATAAATSATSAAASATAAATSATSAAASATSAAASYDSFDDRYLGAKSSNPTLDNDGNALVTGALYFNSVSGTMLAWSGSAWGSISSSAEIYRYKFIAAGGETSVSGADASSQTLTYIAGKEQVYLNGVLLVRGTDYTATNGTSITALSALVVNDVLEIITFTALSVVTDIPQSVVDAKGDLVVGTAADTVGRLAVGTNGYYLKADSTAGTGLAWAAVDLSTYAPLASPTFTGTVTIPTGAVITSPKIASTYTAKTAAYTFASGDEGQLFSMNNASSVQFNIPTDATFNFAIGTEFNVFWTTGAGQPTIGAVTPGTTTVVSTGATSATPKLRVALSGATAKKLAANSWIVFGDIA